MLVSDLGHFLDLPDDAAGPARRVAEHLSRIVRAATAGDLGRDWVSALACRRRPARTACPGVLGVFRTDIPAEIRWWCTDCADAGVISGWERSPFDLRPRGPVPEPARPLEVVVSADDVAALRGLRLVDSTSERIVFRARPTAHGVVLVAEVDDLDELAGYIAAEANHEPDRRHRQRLDHAFTAINHALARAPHR